MTNTQNEPVELLPCPFCGTRPHIEDGRNDRPWVVQCYNRDCRVQPFIDDGDTKTHAIAGWNGIRTTSSAVVDALREDLIRADYEWHGPFGKEKHRIIPPTLFDRILAVLEGTRT